ncbi:hypothetical protein [Streptomyces albidochromogenes]|uniref:Integral membrane protein n=1 Tax=Streptomyces albidochromogenes TaxID=329524 RepID=A0ABW6FR47_9ACTN
MAGHAAVPGRSTRPAEPAGPGTPAGRTGPRHAATVRRRQVIVPVVLGLVYGYYAAFLARDAGAVTGLNFGFGMLCAAVFAGLCFLLGRTQRAMIPLVRAAAYGALTGVAVGFLHSLADNTVLDATIIGLAVGAGMAAATFYIFYTRE